MARLTRTQKYAQLSQEVANDKEQSTSTKQLADLEQRLKNITENLSAPKVEEVEEKVENIFKPVMEFADDVSVEETVQAESKEVEEPKTKKFEWEDFDNSVVSDLESMLADLERAVENNKQKDIVVEEKDQIEVDDVSASFDSIFSEDEFKQEPFEEVIIEPLVEETEGSSEEKSKNLTIDELELDDILGDIPTYSDFQEDLSEIAETKDEVNEEEIFEELVSEESTLDEVVQLEEPVFEVVEETEENIIEDSTGETENESEEPVEVLSEEEPVETIVENVELDKEESEDIETFEEYQDEKTDEEIIEDVVVDEMTPEEIVEVPDTTLFQDEDIVNLLDEAKEDMDLHNKVNGQLGIDDIADSLIEEVRSESKEEVVEPEVILDADKEVEYLDVPLVEEDSDDEFSNTVSLEITKIMEEIPSTPVVENPLVDIVEEPTIAVPVVEEVKEENAVEIKNLNEIDIEPAANTVSSTIPFIVNTNDEDEIEDDEDDEDEGSNTILNIILIILIIVLIIVLGLIIFYILKTKGII